jgi:hypothetical protein
MANSSAFCNPEDFDSIDQIETTTETLTSRAGLALFSRYLRNLGLLSVLERLFGSMRQSEKGLPIPVLFHLGLLLFSGWDPLFTGSLRRAERRGWLRWGDRGELRIDGLLPPD